MGVKTAVRRGAVRFTVVGSSMPLRFVDTDDDAPDAAVDPDDPPAAPPGADPDADDDPPAPAPDADDDPEDDDPPWAPPTGAPDKVVSAATILTAKARVANSPLRLFDVITPCLPSRSAVRQLSVNLRSYDGRRNRAFPYIFFASPLLDDRLGCGT